MKTKAYMDIKKLNFGNLCNLIQKLSRRKETQIQTVRRLYSIVVDEYVFEPIEASTASYLFRGQCKVNKDVSDAALHVLKEQESFSKVKQKVVYKILNQMSTYDQGNFINKLKELVSMLKYDELELKKYIDLDSNSHKDRSLIFVTKCILWCMICENSDEPVNRIALKNKPKSLITYDPHSLVQSRSGSTAVSIVLRQNQDHSFIEKYYDFYRCLEYINKNKLLIEYIKCSLEQIEIYITKLEDDMVFRRLDTEEQYIEASGLVNKYIYEFLPKKCWKGRKLSDMVYNGLETHKWTGYGYYKKDQLVAFLDYKIRTDGSIELGTALVEEQYRNKHLSRSMINFFKLMFFSSGFFCGTYEENDPMRWVFEQTGFRPNLFFDPETEIESNMIQERINPKSPNQLTNSVYYYCYSLMEEILEEIQEVILS